MTCGDLWSFIEIYRIYFLVEYFIRASKDQPDSSQKTGSLEQSEDNFRRLDHDAIIKGVDDYTHKCNLQM